MVRLPEIVMVLVPAAAPASRWLTAYRSEPVSEALSELSVTLKVAAWEPAAQRHIPAAAGSNTLSRPVMRRNKAVKDAPTAGAGET